MALRGPTLLVLCIIACKNDPPCTPGTTKVDGECVDIEADTGEDASGADADEDGFATPEDCDDKDPAVYPDAKEFCDGIDNDCDGEIDEADAVNADTYFVDADLDGFGDPSSTVTSCELEEGMSTDDTDCDDTAETAHPGAEEIWYDGIDNDCLGGSDDDADGDGYAGGDAGVDCDDGNPAIHPDAPEVCGDGTDNNCDGSLGECGRTGSLTTDDADAWLYGATHDNWAGAQVMLASDVTGDGATDLIIGAPRDDLSTANAGTAYVVPGPTAGVGLLADIAHPITGYGNGDLAGSVIIAPGDLDGDGQNDLLIGAPGAGSEPGAGALYMAPGPISEAFDLADSPGWVIGHQEDLGVGSIAAAVGDQDGDTLPELLIGTPLYGEAGAAWVIGGAPEMETSIEDGFALTGSEPGDAAGTSVADVGDINGDGISDMAVGAPGADTSTPGGDSFTDAGVVYILLGPVLRETALSDADAIHRGIDNADNSGSTLAGTGDLDGDGTADIAVGAPGASGQAGKVFIIAGPATSDGPLALATAQVIGVEAFGELGASLASAGDANSDGLMDLLIGAPQTGGGTGHAVLFYGPITGSLTADEADLSITGDSPGHRLGASLAGGQDIDGDGTHDLLIGVPGEDTAGDGAGAALIFFSIGS